MAQTNQSSKEAQHIIALFLREEFLKLKSEYEYGLKKRIIKRRYIEKKKQTLQKKVEAILNLHGLNETIKDDLFCLLKEIKDLVLVS